MPALGESYKCMKNKRDMRKCAESFSNTFFWFKCWQKKPSLQIISADVQIFHFGMTKNTIPFDGFCWLNFDGPLRLVLNASDLEHPIRVRCVKTMCRKSF